MLPQQFFGSMLLFLVAEIAGGAYIYNQQDEFQENLQKTIQRAVTKDYGNRPEVNIKMDLIQTGVSSTNIIVEDLKFK